MHRSSLFANVTALTLATLLSVPVSAAPVTLPVTSIVEGGGTWGELGTSGGIFSIEDATHTASVRGDAFDGAFAISVDNVAFVPGVNAEQASVVVNAATIGTSLTSAQKTMSGVNVSQQFLFFSNPLGGLPVARCLVTLENPGTSAVAVSVSQNVNLGSDSDTALVATSSGDTSFSNADHWVVTSDNAPSSGDPIVTSVFSGPDYDFTSGSRLFFQSGADAFYSRYSDILIPAGEKRYILLFAQLSDSTATAQTAATNFNTNQGIVTAGLLADLEAGVLSRIINWPGLDSANGGLGGKVWFDTNGNGLLDGAEAGISGVGVKLQDGSGVVTAATMVSDTNGNYTTGALAPGSYLLLLDFPAFNSLTLSAKDVGTNDAIDSDFDPTTKKTAVINHTGTGVSNINAGLYIPSLIDTDNDGAPDNKDLCPADANKLKPLVCGCGTADVDSNLNGVVDCQYNAEVKARTSTLPTLIKQLVPGLAGAKASRTLKTARTDLATYLTSNSGKFTLVAGSDLNALSSALDKALAKALKRSAATLAKDKKAATKALTELLAALS